MRKWAVFVLALAMTSLAQESTGLAQANEPDAATRDEAARRYARGVELYAEENFPGALAEFRRAQSLTGEYRVLYNMGQVCFQLHDYVCAMESFEKYLTLGGSKVPANRQTDVKSDLDKLRTRVGSLSIKVNEDGANVVVDDVARGQSPVSPITLSAGKHRVSAAKEGMSSASQSVEIVGQATSEVKLDLVPLQSKQVVITERVEVPKESGLPTLSYVGFGVAGAFAAAGAVTGVLALSASSDLKSSKFTGRDAPPDVEDLSTRTSTLAWTTNALFVASAATLGLTLYYTLTREPSQSSPSKTALVLGPGSAYLRGEF